MSWDEWLTFDAISAASRITVPTLVIHADNAAYPNNVRRFHVSLGGSKDLFWTQGGQIDFYDIEPFVTKAANAAVSHFSVTLA